MNVIVAGNLTATTVGEDDTAIWLHRVSPETRNHIVNQVRPDQVCTSHMWDAIVDQAWACNDVRLAGWFDSDDEFQAICLVES